MQVFCFSFVKCLCSGDALARLVLVLSRFFRVDIRRVLRVRTKSTGLALGHAWEITLGPRDTTLNTCIKSGLLLVAAYLFCVSPPIAWSKDRGTPSAGLVMEFSGSYDDALRALQEIVQDQTIHGTYMFDRDKNLTGAVTADSTPLFDRWEGSGKVFYKIRTGVIAPRHFLDSADLGTIAVRYVLTSISAQRTGLRIDAIFVEKAHRALHISDGTVESSEY